MDKRGANEGFHVLEDFVCEAIHDPAVPFAPPNKCGQNEGVCVLEELPRNIRMDGDRFDLYFGPLKIGVVTQTGSDFPNLWGNITYDPALVDPQTAEIARFVRFIALNRESMRLVDMEPERDSSQEQEAVIIELETHYMDYVESEDWCLIDKQGHKLPILCPILRGESEIVWRWHPGGE